MSSEVPPAAPNGPSSAPAASMPLRWHRVRVRLRNTRNVFAREHPLFVLRAIFLHALRPPGGRELPEDLDWTFHPVGAEGLPARIEHGRIYEVDVVFAGADPTAAGAFAANLRDYAGPSGGLRNFALENVGPPEARTPTDLDAETPAPDWGSDELCLEFLTPLSFRPADPARRWELGAGAFVEMLTARVDRFFGVSCRPPGTPLPAVELLPFWDFERFRHESKSGPPGAGVEFLVGMAGPLFLRGDWPALWPLLLLGAELHLGAGVRRGQGRYVFPPAGTRGGGFDQRLRDDGETLFVSTLREMFAEADPDTAGRLAETFGPGEEETDEAARRLAGDVRAGTYRPQPARAVPIPKRAAGPPGGGPPADPRVIALLAPADALVHRVLHRLLAPRLERLLGGAAHGYRPGRSVETARQAIAAAAREGFTHVVEADIEAFFDDVDWTLLGETLRRVLPRADAQTLALVEDCVRAPLLVAAGGQGDEASPPAVYPRERGLLQGSPLSPLLANLYLEPFDAAILARGHRLVRYGDDFLILTRSPADAERALAAAAELLAPLRLTLRREKTSVVAAGAGFRFLGLSFGGDLGDADEDFIDATTLRRTLFLTRPYAWAGLEGDAVVVRQGRELLARVPLHRIGEIVLLGAGGVSAALVARCAARHIPMTFTSQAGHYQGTVRADSRATYELAYRQGRRHEELGETGRAEIAARIVAAKLANTLAWLRELPPESPVRRLTHRLRDTLRVLRGKPSSGGGGPRRPPPWTVERVRGLEGEAARGVFAFVNGRAREEGFASRGRQARARADRWNLLVDLASFLLFTRLNAMLRTRGLNPYLGFLHSALDPYESLVCDLQEPFRCRLDRLVLRVINRRILGADDFIQSEEGRWRLKPEGWARFLESFEREMNTKLAGETDTLRHLLAAQVAAVRAWAEGKADTVRFFDLGREAAGEGRFGEEKSQTPPEPA